MNQAAKSRFAWKIIVEVLKAYSHIPSRLYDLRKTWEVVHGQLPDEHDEDRNEEASRPRQWSMTDRLSPRDVQAIIDQYHAGTIAKDLAEKFGISLSSVRRLLRKHGSRLIDRQEDTG